MRILLEHLFCRGCFFDAKKAGVIMDAVLNKNIPAERELLSALDRGIDDMESGPILSPAQTSGQQTGNDQQKDIQDDCDKMADLKKQLSAEKRRSLQKDVDRRK